MATKSLYYIKNLIVIFIFQRRSKCSGKFFKTPLHEGDVRSKPKISGRGKL